MRSGTSSTRKGLSSEASQAILGGTASIGNGIVPRQNAQNEAPGQAPGWREANSSSPMADVDITPHQTIPHLDYCAQPSDHSGRPLHRGHHHHHLPTSRAGSHIKPRDYPSREATGGEEPLTTPASTPPTLDGITVDSSTTPAAQSPPPPQPRMLFSDLYRSPKSPLSKLRHSLPHPIPVLPPGIDEDLVSRDKAKQKEAVKRFLVDRVRCDWEFNWPPQQGPQHVERSRLADAKAVPWEDAATTGSIRNSSEHVRPNTDAAVNAASEPVPAPDAGVTSIPTSPTSKTELIVPKDAGEEADLESDALSVYSTVSEDALHYRPRADWTSDLSDDDIQPSKPVLSPFRFDSPDSVGVAVQSSLQARRTRRRREVREESNWNNGLACYNARRDAWTGARTVRVKPRATPVTSPVSPISPRRLFWRTHSRTESASSTGTQPLTTVVSAPAATPAHTTTPLSPTTTHASNHSSTLSSEDVPPCARHISSTSTASPSPYPVETLLPIPPPLIPPQNPMRASITPQIYPSLYDKVVVHSLQPSCPINLSDMVASCVAGWKRDGEWPPRSAPAPPTVVAVRRKKSDAAQQQQHGRKGSTPGLGEKGRRMSFGFLKGAREEEKAHNEKEGLGKEEVEGGSAGKGIRRSLQKVFSGLSHHHGEEGEHGHVKETAVM